MYVLEEGLQVWSQPLLCRMALSPTWNHRDQFPLGSDIWELFRLLLEGGRAPGRTEWNKKYPNVGIL
jgi:hypothetical protein